MFLFYLILIVIFIIYNITGYYLIIPLILALANFILATFNLVYDPKNMSSRLIQLISLAYIVFMIILNIKILILGDDLTKLAYIIPLSVSKITFLDEVYGNVFKGDNMFYFKNPFFTWFHFFDSKEISDFLEKKIR